MKIHLDREEYNFSIWDQQASGGRKPPGFVKWFKN